MSLDGKPDYEEKTQRTKIVSNESHNVYGIASGWRYDFPWIETVTLAEKEGWEKRPAYLHYGSAGVIPIKTEQDEAGRRYPIQGLENYEYEDVKLEDWNKTVDGTACKYLLRDKTGLRTYFNENGVIVLQKDAHGNTIRYTYTDGIYFSKITDSVGREIKFHYSESDGERTLTKVTVQGNATVGGVNQKNVIYETEEKNYTPHHGDRLHGVILTAATVDGSKEKYAYQTVERLVNTAGAGVASQRVSTNQSYLLNKITANGSETHYEYRAGSLRGQKGLKDGLTSTDIRGKNRVETATTYETDEFGRTTKENTVTRKQQDGKWLPAYETQTLSTYDDNGNISQTETKSRKEGETQWQSQTVKTDYNEQGQVIQEYTPRGTKENVATRYEYDILGRVVQSEIPQEKKDGSITYQKNTTKYDNAGNVTEKNEPVDGDRTAKTGYTYDKRGNLVMLKSHLDGEKAQYVQYVYDIQGNKVRQFTGMTEPLTLTVTEVAKDTKAEDTFTYAGKTYQLTVSGKKKIDDIRETKYEYDGKNQLVAFTDPEGRRETYTYDRNSNLTKTVDKNGNTLKNEYDYRNRLTEMAAKEQKTGKETKHSYTYNAYGDIATQDDTAFVYDDAAGQVTKETTKLTKNKDVVKNYSYDSAGNKSAFAVKVGDDTKLFLKYTYDGESKLTAVTDETGNEIAAYNYDADGNLSQRTVAGADLTTTYAYDYQNRLTDLKNQTGNAGVISEYTSEYLVNGQKSKETADMADKDGKKTTKTSTYTYDLLGRITKETQTGREDITYTYDSNNNRKEMKAGNKITAYQYNKNDELLRTDTLNTDTEEDTVVLYKNDRNGNQLATVNRYEIPNERKDRPYIDIDVTLGDNRLNENTVNHYNALNQLTKTLTKNYKVSFTYDSEGLRTSKTVNGEKTVFVWDGGQLVMELSGGGKVKKRYIRGNGRGSGSNLLYADKGTENASKEASEKQYYVTDSHGNVVQLTDEKGNVIKTYEYDSFGNEVKPDGKDDNPFRYCGEYYDKETEEIYLRARYYQPEMGRFLTRDTYTGEEDEPLSLQLYTYCENDGVNMVDPSGHDGIWLYAKDGAAIGPLTFGHVALVFQGDFIRPSNWNYISWAKNGLTTGVVKGYNRMNSKKPWKKKKKKTIAKELRKKVNKKFRKGEAEYTSAIFISAAFWQTDEKANELKQTHNYRLLSYNCTQFICNVIGESVKFHNNQSILKDSFLDLMTETFPRKSTKKVREIKKVYGL